MAVTGNAADPKQVRNAERRTRRRDRDFLDSLEIVLASPHGRLVMWELLARAGVYRSVWDQSGSKTYYNAGRQDYGHELLTLLLEASPALYIEMETEARRREARERSEVEAAATPPAMRESEQ